MSGPTHDRTQITARYRMSGQLGVGSMGAVYRAYDRLTGHDVALKRVILDDDDADELRLALAHEFRTLAGLRHPHIISVLDYGFDAEQQPYFTMELLQGATSLLEVGQTISQDRKIDLLVQALEALAYLHRRGVLHHDLKPDNMLIADGRTRLLDFGLATLANQPRDDDAFGTLQYLAPEVLDGQPYTEAADLYSLGVIAYELLAGRHPFPAETVHQFFDQVFHSSPDLAPFAGEPAVAQVLSQLLAKSPAGRPVSAQATLTALRAALGQPEHQPDAAIRESYLQAASFVGREAELGQLMVALEQARQGHGSAWLIGGESGVGKSRLLDELRTQALVQGVQVLRGQGVADGGLAYQLWREPLRMLALASELSALEAGVLLPLVPDLPTLLDHAVAGAPLLTGNENAQRLARVVLGLLRRQTQPLVLVFEDLQWADESIGVLQAMLPLLADRPMVVLGTYRDDERPDLPQELPGMQLVPLARLPHAALAELSAAMLGERGQQPEVVALLERETEGNAFFMVEVVRALAEESGSLAAIGHTTLPAQVFAGGVQRIIQRRLERVPAAGVAALQLAAILGRQIDLAALGAALPGLDLDGWLRGCAEAVVLEVQDEHWRFAHDKLREGVLTALLDEQQARLHQQAADAIAQAYAADLAPQAARLAEHYRLAGMVEQERQYARQAGDYAAATFINTEAIRHYSRALELTSDAREGFALLLAREAIYNRRGERDAQAADLESLDELATQLQDTRCQLTVALQRVRQAASSGNLPEVLRRVEPALALAQAQGNPASEAEIRFQAAATLVEQSDIPGARAQAAVALGLARAADRLDLAADCLRNLGMGHSIEGKLAVARDYMLQSLDLCRELGDKEREAAVLNSLAINAEHHSDLRAAKSYLEEALRLNRLVGRSENEALVLMNLGVNADAHGNYDLAEAYYQQALELNRLIRNQLYICYTVLNLGDLALVVGNLERAQQYLEDSLQQSQILGAPREESQAHTCLARLALARDQLDEATYHAQIAKQLIESLDLFVERSDIDNLLGTIRLRQGDLSAAAAKFQAVLDVPAQNIPAQLVIPARARLAEVYLAQGLPELAAQHARAALAQVVLPETIQPEIYLACYRALLAHGDPDAATVLETGYQQLQRRAASIADPARRQMYLEQVRSNRELLAAWQERLNARA